MTEATFNSIDTWIVISIVLGSLVAGLLAAGVEAVSNSSLIKAQALKEQAPRRATSLELLLSENDLLTRLRFLVLGLQFSICSASTYLAIKFFEFPISLAAIAGFIVLLIPITETIPITMGHSKSDSLSLALSGLLVGSAKFLPVRALSGIALKFADLAVPGKAHRYSVVDSAEELVALADAAVEDEILEPEEKELIESIILFGETVVREVMVPRPDMKVVAHSQAATEVLQQASEYGFSRLPVIEDSTDDVVGVVYVKDLVKAEIADELEKPVVDLARKAEFVPESKKVAELLKDMQRRQFHMALAVDEYGGIAGLVTLEDLIEEIVGEIVDEYDTEEPMFYRLSDGSFRVDARMLVDEANDLGGVELPEGAWDTVGGLVFDQFGRVPAVGEAVEVGAHRLKIERVQGRRITRVRVEHLEVVEMGDND